MTDQLCLTLESSLAEVATLAEALERFAAGHALPVAIRSAINLALEEIVTNIILHGYQGQPGKAIRVDITLRPGVVQLCVEDSAPPFNPLLAPEPDLTLSLDQRVPGGLGVHLVRKMMDHLEYERSAGKNRLTMLKRF